MQSLFDKLSWYCIEPPYALGVIAVVSKCNPSRLRILFYLLLLQYVQGNGNTADKSVKINYTFLQEIHIIPEYIITKQSGYEPVCILCWCTDLGAAQYLCQRGTCGWLLSIPNIITWNSRGWTLIQEKVKEYQKQYLTDSHSFHSETSVYGSSSPA